MAISRWPRLPRSNALRRLQGRVEVSRATIAPAFALVLLFAVWPVTAQESEVEPSALGAQAVELPLADEAPGDSPPSAPGLVVVDAGAAGLDPADWVVGVARDGRASAVELGLLLQQGLVHIRTSEDTEAGDLPVALVASSDIDAVVGCDRRVMGEIQTFELTSARYRGTPVVRSADAEHRWPLLHGGLQLGEDALEPSPAAGRERLRWLGGIELLPWGAWRARHPETTLIGVAGEGGKVQTAAFNQAASFAADSDRVFAFFWRGRPHAVAHEDIVGGRLFTFDEAEGGSSVFLYRAAGDAPRRSTVAILFGQNARAERDGQQWTLRGASGRDAAFDLERRDFGAPLRRLAGTDLPRDAWTRVHPDGVIVEPAR
ncbi:MAG: hypothetical protein AAGN46_01625 [Acidobacteriota bacterium]